MKDHNKEKMLSMLLMIGKLLETALSIGLRVKFLNYLTELKTVFSEDSRQVKKSLPVVFVLACLFFVGVLTTWYFLLLLIWLCIDQLLQSQLWALLIIGLINVSVTGLLLKKLYRAIQNVGFLKTLRNLETFISATGKKY